MKFDSNEKLSEGVHGGGVADGGISHALALVRLIIVQKFEVHDKAVGSLLPQGLHGTKKDSYRMSTANGIAEFFKVVSEGFVIKRLDYLHTLKIDFHLK